MNTKSETKHWERIADGIWKNNRSGSLFERPKISGSWTFRSLKTKNLKHAREELHRRRSGLSPLAAPSDDPPLTVGDILRRYQKDSFPDRQKQPRQGRTLECETRNCTMLLKFWARVPVNDLSLIACDRYHEWRKKRILRGTGDRTVDLEMNTLSNAILWGMRLDLIRQNPLGFRRPRYCISRHVRHCREFMPHDTEALHEVGALLLANIRSATLGWQLMFEAFTGLRTCEALGLRTDAQPYEPGWITPDGKSLCVRRAKNQESVNPFVRVHEGLAAWLKAHAAWKQRRYPDSPWFFPSYRDPDNKPADICGLGQALRQRRDKIGRKITSHGMRAYYITVRRSNSIPDIQIAYEIGHTSAGKTLASVYGGVPPHWLLVDGPKLKWLPENARPAWEVINSEPEELPNPVQNIGAPAGCPSPVVATCNEAAPAPTLPAMSPSDAQLCPPIPTASALPLCEITICSCNSAAVTL